LRTSTLNEEIFKNRNIWEKQSKPNQARILFQQNKQIIEELLSMSEVPMMSECLASHVHVLDEDPVG
jgi:hypothetical protein